jgi:hypothetical protein
MSDSKPKLILVDELCHCGRPLHYTDPVAERFVREMIALKGPNLVVTVAGRSWSVPRHYLALHGLKGSEVASLGFREIREEKPAPKYEPGKLKPADGYELLDEGRAIKCYVCGMVSHNPNDVAQRYCGNCHRFHEDT